MHEDQRPSQIPDDPQATWQPTRRRLWFRRAGWLLVAALLLPGVFLAAQIAGTSSQLVTGALQAVQNTTPSVSAFPGNLVPPGVLSQATPTRSAQTTATRSIPTPTYSSEYEKVMRSNSVATRPADVVVASFQSRRLTLADYERLLAFQKAAGMVNDPTLDYDSISNLERLRQLQSIVLNSYISQELILSEIQSGNHSYSFTSTDISARLDKYLGTSSGKQDLANRLRRYGLTVEDFKKFIRDLLLIEAYLNTTVLNDVPLENHDTTLQAYLVRLREMKQVMVFMQFNLPQDETFLKFAELAALEYYKQKDGGTVQVTAITRDFNSHIQISIVRDEYIVYELGYASDAAQAYELQIQPR